MKQLFKIFGIGLITLSPGTLLAGDSLPPVTASGLHTKTNWPSEMFGPRTLVEDVDKDVHPLDRGCVKKQMEELKKVSEPLALKGIHIDLRYGIDVKKPFTAQVITDHRINGPFNLHFGERKTLRLEITMPSARLGKDKCNIASAEAINQALRKPGTSVGPLELTEAVTGQRTPAAQNAVSERRESKDTGYSISGPAQGAGSAAHTGR